jgi:guanylate kinase
VKKSIIFSAPSGSGKTTVVKHLLQVMGEQLAFSVSATTRKPRAGELDGREYHFLEAPTFKQHIQNNEFLEYEEVYAGILYGTLWSEVHKIWNQNKAVIFDVDVKGGLNLRPPSVEILMDRLTKRSTEVEHQLKERIAKANYELSFENQYDIVVVNDDLNTTLKECENIVQNFLIP